jgi:predicted phosphodiesterase
MRLDSSSNSQKGAAVRTAIISDIHGNLDGLLAALGDAESAGCERVVCLGDLVEGGSHDLEVVREIRDRRIPCVRGNHDEGFAHASRLEEALFVRGLPERIIEGDRLYVHVSPREVPRTVRDQYEAWGVFDETPHRLIFVGHGHVPLVFASHGSVTGSAARVGFVPNYPMPLNPDSRYIVCPGAIGYGRDGIRAVRYAILDDDANSLEIRSIRGHVLDYG